MCRAPCAWAARYGSIAGDESVAPLRIFGAGCSSRCSSEVETAPRGTDGLASVCGRQEETKGTVPRVRQLKIPAPETPKSTIPAEGRALDSLLRERLLDWFAHTKRALPWRESRDPYRVWISEAMLQQTRVETVVPYFLRFVARFPDVQTLSAASIEDVLAHWSGLGYYRRARALHEAARTIVTQMGGAIPSSVESLRTLPGFGPYTAGAVSSIAFDEREPLVDGNVARVLARIFAIDTEPASKSFRESTWSQATRLVRAGGDAGAWNQALMELGALVCLPREPACGACPVRHECRALAEDRVEDLPRPKARRQPIDVELQVLVVREGARILLEQRPPDGRMAGLWQLPMLETSPGELIAPAQFASPALRVGEKIGEIRHTITSHRLRVHVHVGHSTGAADGSFAWFPVGEVESLPRTGMTKKILARAWPASERVPGS
jgi:A/G-specific adenine glycosylase